MGCKLLGNLTAIYSYTVCALHKCTLCQKGCEGQGGLGPGKCMNINMYVKLYVISGDPKPYEVQITSSDPSVLLVSTQINEVCILPY